MRRPGLDVLDVVVLFVVVVVVLHQPFRLRCQSEFFRTILIYFRDNDGVI